MRGALAVAIVTFVFIYVSGVSFFTIKAPSDIVYTVLGALLAQLANIVNYYFGTSQSSTDKDKVILKPNENNGNN